ncbi:DUF2057 family protein [Enterobacteriaceae bacterium LUAb1]
MKFRLLITGFSSLMMTFNICSSTLKLNNETNLLVLDGQKISGSLLKGAESLELGPGKHQILFNVEKNIKYNDNEQEQKYTSIPLIATFTTNAKTITIHILSLTATEECTYFNQHPEFQLTDENGQVINSHRDTLQKNIKSHDIEQAMSDYNLTGLPAAVPQFAQQTADQLPETDNGTLQNRIKNSHILLLNQINRLYLWMSICC